MVDNSNPMTPTDPGWFAKSIEAIKDVPAWMLTGVAIATDLLVFVPALSRELSPETKPWLFISAVLFNALAVSKWISVGVTAWRASKAAAKAKKTFHMSPVTQNCFWSVTKQPDDSMVTQITADLLVKNQSAASIGLIGVRLIKPRIKGDVVTEHILVRGERRHEYGSVFASGHRIPAGAALPAHATIFIRGVPTADENEPMTVTWGIKDDDGNEQRLVTICRGLPAPNPIENRSLPEPLYAITDPVEKEVVSVLQSELGRYDKAGRGSGGLGSIHIVYRGFPMIGMGTEMWRPNSPVNQEIADDPEAAELRSDNLAVLVAYHERLQSYRDRERFATALLERLHPDRGYLRVSYFTVCVLWKIGEFNAALGQAQSSLPQAEIKDFGLSNVLMMLNGLLRYRHPDFTPHMLDQIERFVHGLNEHPFQIPQKIAAIRATRLAV
jgi:hypothetical protein